MFGRRRTYEKEHKKMIPFCELKYEEVIKEYLNYTIYTQEEINLIEKAAYRRNHRNGKYHANGKGMGPDNPSVVGMPDCSDTLVYDRSKDRWILTDGLGNGWIR